MEGLEAGGVSLESRKRLAGKVFDLTSAYDAAIARYLLEPDKQNTEYPAFWPLSLKKEQNLRYGENNHQSAALYLNAGSPGALAGMEQLHGKDLSYNNIRDLDLAWKAACAFGYSPGGGSLSARAKKPLGESDIQRLIPQAVSGGKACCVAVKHSTPCGIALGETLFEAFKKTLACDPVSIFGGIVASNSTVDKKTASAMGELFLEIVAAPDFENGALEILKKKKNLRIIKAACAPGDTKEYAAVDGGLLVQDTDNLLLEKWEVVTRLTPADEDIPDLVFGLRAVTFVKSNAILIVKDLAAAGIGGGQVNRVWSATQALQRSAAAIKAASRSLSGSVEKGGPWADGRCAKVLASDAFFPFPDVVEAAAAAGIKAIIQPGGSVNDKLSIEACDRLGLAMVFTGTRHFKH
jgi:phosphoribosylaminoimidazolecarboxamide formyltransferase/IMP cyclohydrolase